MSLLKVRAVTELLEIFTLLMLLEVLVMLAPLEVLVLLVPFKMLVAPPLLNVFWPGGTANDVRTTDALEAV